MLKNTERDESGDREQECNKSDSCGIDKQGKEMEHKDKRDNRKTPNPDSEDDGYSDFEDGINQPKPEKGEKGDKDKNIFPKPSKQHVNKEK